MDEILYRKDIQIKELKEYIKRLNIHIKELNEYKTRRDFYIKKIEDQTIDNYKNFNLNIFTNNRFTIIL